MITSRLLLKFLDFLFEIKVLGYNCGISVTIIVTIKFGFMGAFSVKRLVKVSVDMKLLFDKKMSFNSIN